MNSQAFQQLPPNGRSTMQYYDAIRRALLSWSPTPPIPTFYLRPDGVSFYRRPDGTSRYVRPS